MPSADGVAKAPDEPSEAMDIPDWAQDGVVTAIIRAVRRKGFNM